MARQMGETKAMESLARIKKVVSKDGKALAILVQGRMLGAISDEYLTSLNKLNFWHGELLCIFSGKCACAHLFCVL